MQFLCFFFVFFSFLVPFLIMVPVPDPVPDQAWFRSCHISGPGLGPGKNFWSRHTVIRDQQSAQFISHQQTGRQAGRSSITHPVEIVLWPPSPPHQGVTANLGCCFTAREHRSRTAKASRDIVSARRGQGVCVTLIQDKYCFSDCPYFLNPSGNIS